jgi:hypothetical protein
MKRQKASAADVATWSRSNNDGMLVSERAELYSENADVCILFKKVRRSFEQPAYLNES